MISTVNTSVIYYIEHTIMILLVNTSVIYYIEHTIIIKRKRKHYIFSVYTKLITLNNVKIELILYSNKREYIYYHLKYDGSVSTNHRHPFPWIISYIDLYNNVS